MCEIFHTQYYGKFISRAVKKETILQANELKNDLGRFTLSMAPIINVSINTAKDSPIITYQILWSM